MYGKKILVVEDEFIVALDLKRSVSGFGYSVSKVVHSGEEAIEAVSKDKPDLILMDIILKGKLTGLEAGKTIWERYKIPIIYITSFFDDSTLRHNLEYATSYDYLIKPFKESDLKLKINNFISAA